jgi:hypothetical protein
MHVGEKEVLTMFVKQQQYLKNINKETYRKQQQQQQQKTHSLR